MTIPNAYDDPTAYDVLVLAGKISPGVVKISNVARETGWDEQQAQGQDFANAIKKGSKLVSFTATWTLMKDENRDDFAAWELWAPILDTPVKAKDAKAIDCYHPMLAELHVKSVVVKKRGAREPQFSQQTGSETVSVDFLEFHPPKASPALGPNGSKDKSAPDPNADVKVQLFNAEVQNAVLKASYDKP